MATVLFFSIPACSPLFVTWIVYCLCQTPATHFVRISSFSFSFLLGGGSYRDPLCNGEDSKSQESYVTGQYHINNPGQNPNATSGLPSPEPHTFSHSTLLQVNVGIPQRENCLLLQLTQHPHLSPTVGQKVQIYVTVAWNFFLGILGFLSIPSHFLPWMQLTTHTRARGTREWLSGVVPSQGCTFICFSAEQGFSPHPNLPDSKLAKPFLFRLSKQFHP